MLRKHIKIFFKLSILAAASFLLCSCWQVAAARAAKKRTTQTGYIVGLRKKGLEPIVFKRGQTLDNYYRHISTSFGALFFLIFARLAKD